MNYSEEALRDRLQRVVEILEKNAAQLKAHRANNVHVTASFTLSKIAIDLRALMAYMEKL